jgi:formylglycine-generating enzyme required for sulfatase activity
MKQCADLALTYALRDATEKGGKAVIEAVTKVEMFQLVKDEIKMTVKVQVLEQDTSGDYGKAIRIKAEDKYIAKVRVKVQSIDTANPYREQLAVFEKGKPEGTVLPATEVGKREQPVPAGFVLVEGGSFTMGDLFGEEDSDGKPTHQVTLTYDFYIGKYEVTFGEYDAYCNVTDVIKPGDQDWGRGNRPAINVYWWDAIKYSNWLSQREGRLIASTTTQGSAAAFSAFGLRGLSAYNFTKRLTKKALKKAPE